MTLGQALEFVFADDNQYMVYYEISSKDKTVRADSRQGAERLAKAHLQDECKSVEVAQEGWDNDKVILTFYI